jgi:gamma-glutamyltranspeptidase / glutathione hydrolase
VNATRMAPLLLVAAAHAIAHAQAGPLVSARGAVAAEDVRASQAGADVLADGGNAVDAAVATALAAGVVNPASSGIGGGGFALVWDAGRHTLYVYDFREVAPASLDPGDFVVGGKLDAMRARYGGLAVGVPGEVRGLSTLSRRHGRLSWRRVVMPSAHLAREGAPISEFLAWAAADERPEFGPDAQARMLAFVEAAKEGTPLARPALAQTLLTIGVDPEAFYHGALADDLIATVRAAGGVMTAADLDAYRVVEREPLIGRWNGLRLATMPLPSSGGVILLEALGILERTGIDLRALGAGSSAELHLVAEALEHGFADRAKLMGDSDAGRAAAATFLDDARLTRLAKKIRIDRTQPPEAYGESPPTTPTPPKRGGTAHICVVDAEGNAVALTTTVNGYFGSHLLADGGFVLNNQIDDFTVDPAAENLFGLTQSEANLVGPGKRPLSSMTPTLLFDGDRVVGCVGGSGGPRIISNTLQSMLNAWLFGMDAYTAVASPRVHHQWSPNELKVDPFMSPAVKAELTKRGHKVVDLKTRSAVQLIKVRPDGTVEAASDPRKGGRPAAPAPAP